MNFYKSVTCLPKTITGELFNRLKIYIDPKRFTSTPAFKSVSPTCLGIFGCNFVWSISGTLVLTDIKMKKKNITKLGHSDGLKIYVNPSKMYVDSGM